MTNYSITNPIEIAKKWFEVIGFSNEVAQEFYKSINNYKIDTDASIYTYDKECEDGIKNLIYYLYFCENAKELYVEKGIPKEILISTIKDIKIWCDTWSKIKGRLYLGELPWLDRHLSLKLFQLGRLQFCMQKAPCDIDKYGVKKGEGVIGIHIPEGEKLSVDACNESINQAREFFDRYFPEFNYKIFTCHSWLLDQQLERFLSKESGIIKFSNLFDKVDKNESFSNLKFLFDRNTTIENLIDKESRSSLSAKVKDAVLKGEKFYEVLGVIKK